MHPGIVAELASKTTEHGPTFLGEGFVGWRTALIAAIPAAILYEMTMALTRKMTLRLPFLILNLARLSMPKEEWEYQSQEWKAELWNILGDGERHWFLRFTDGMAFAIPLAAGGARQAATASKKAELTPRSTRVPKRGRHAARRSTRARVVRLGCGAGVFYVFAAAGAQLTRGSTESWLVWTALLGMAFFIMLMALILTTDALERRRVFRELDRLHREVNRIRLRSAALSSSAATRAPEV